LVSPLITIPTFLVLGQALVSAPPPTYPGHDYYLQERGAYVLSLLVSSLWHLILLVPALNKKSAFVRWHGWQALLLAGVRTALSFGWGFVSMFRWFVLTYFPGYLDLCAMPFLIGVWLGSTLWGMREANRGECTLMRWFGRAEAQPARPRAAESTQETEAE
jgi:hypothetical protein